jgi:hypothetical protein
MLYILNDYNDRIRKIRADNDKEAISAALDMLGRNHGGVWEGDDDGDGRFVRGWNEDWLDNSRVAALFAYDEES